MLIRRHSKPPMPGLPLPDPEGIYGTDAPKGGRQQQDGSYLSPILLEIERRLSETGMSASRFGRLAANDPRLVDDLRKGRDPSSRMVARVRAFLEECASIEC